MIKPWLWLPASISHRLSSVGVELASYLADDWENNPKCTWKPFRWNGLEFKNRLGIAGGLDKNADQIEAWQKLGAGFMEVGTITPKPQAPNPGRIMARDSHHQALWNKMGFPSKGAHLIWEDLRFTEKRVPLFINIGKNRTTPLEKAVDDYVELTEKFRSIADVIVVNISSPNTPGLRNLGQAETMRQWLGPVIKKAIDTPVTLKLSPDMEEKDLKETVRTAIGEGVSGFIVSNTTLSRAAGLDFPQEGGVSGLPLKEKAIWSLEKVLEATGNERSSLLVVSCGGVMTASDVFDRLNRGADLVQVYSALVFNGPGFLKEVALEWKKLKVDDHA